jgi:DNA-binding response OmpR family regulator
MEPAYILVIEDDDIVARTIERSLRGDEFRVRLANSGVEGLKIARRNPPDLVILDIIMPGMDGYAVCREMRADSLLEHVPVLFLTAKIKDEDKIAGFLAGADDYLGKPFNIDELILRVRAILRRMHYQAAAIGAAVGPGLQPGQATQNQQGGEEKGYDESYQLVVEDFILDTRTFELHTPQRGRIRLTPVQYDLLHHLMSHAGEIFTPQRLLDEVWDYPTDSGSPDLVRVHVKNLRERIENDPRAPTFIRTVPGFGYAVGLEKE